MPKSMTGYGYSQQHDEVCSQEWEIKSVNGKQLSLRWRLPSYLRSFEAEWEKDVRRVAQRGRVDVSLQVTIVQPEMMPVRLNQGLALAMLGELEDLAARRGDDWQPDYAQLLSVTSLWQESPLTGDGEHGERFRQGLLAALHEWDRFRVQEGQALIQDLQTRVEKLCRWVQKLATQTHALAEERLTGLRERVTQLLDREESGLDQNRMLQELAILADRLDVSEEITRLHTHLHAFEEYLTREQAGGRKLDFMLQECFREINTLGNKAQNSHVSQLVVDFKAELEKCREQVQNLE